MTTSSSSPWTSFPISARPVVAAILQLCLQSQRHAPRHLDESRAPQPGWPRLQCTAKDTSQHFEIVVDIRAISAGERDQNLASVGGRGRERPQVVDARVTGERRELKALPSV